MLQHMALLLNIICKIMNIVQLKVMQRKQRLLALVMAKES